MLSSLVVLLLAAHGDSYSALKIFRAVHHPACRIFASVRVAKRIGYATDLMGQYPVVFNAGLVSVIARRHWCPLIADFHGFTIAVSGVVVPRDGSGGVHRYSLSRALFNVLSFQSHLDVLRTLSAVLGFKVGSSKSFPQVILADLPYLSPMETTSMTWTSRDCSLSHSFLNIPQENTGYEPNSEIDMAKRFVPIVDLTHDDEHAHSHMSDVPVRLPVSANAPSNNSALATF